MEIVDDEHDDAWLFSEFDTKAVRRSLLERSDHVRRSDVFPLPGGAEMTVTFLAVARSSAAKRSSRLRRPGARERPAEVSSAERSRRCAVSFLIMPALRSVGSVASFRVPPAADVGTAESLRVRTVT
jgi:hypothetical protein